MSNKFTAWAARNMPTRESMEHNRFIRPFAHYALRSELWRFTRRSVPRGVAIGLLVGIFALLPGVQIVGATLMCVPCRGNVPIAALMTFLSNPATTPFILIGSVQVGNKLGFHADLTTLNRLYSDGAGLREWTYWLLSDAAPALLLGLFVISVVVAAIGYLIAAIGWRGWIASKRRRHLAHRAQRASLAE